MVPTSHSPWGMVDSCLVAEEMRRSAWGVGMPDVVGVMEGETVSGGLVVYEG
jgi:hypothetical protein